MMYILYNVLYIQYTLYKVSQLRLYKNFCRYTQQLYQQPAENEQLPAAEQSSCMYQNSSGAELKYSQILEQRGEAVQPEPEPEPEPTNPEPESTQETKFSHLPEFQRLSTEHSAVQQQPSVEEPAVEQQPEEETHTAAVNVKEERVERQSCQFANQPQLTVSVAHRESSDSTNEEPPSSSAGKYFFFEG